MLHTHTHFGILPVNW